MQVQVRVVAMRAGGKGLFQWLVTAAQGLRLIGGVCCKCMALLVTATVSVPVAAAWHL